MPYTNQEYVDMLLIYGECHQNGAEAERTYRERFPNRQHPVRRTFYQLVQRLLDGHPVAPAPGVEGGGNRGRQRPVRVDEQVLGAVAANPGISCRRIARDLGISKSTANRVILDDGQHPFHLRKVQNLEPGDHQRRIEFCQWMLRRHAEDENFLRNILFTDESTFTREGVFNQHNIHLYDHENPHATRRKGYQHRWNVNAWCGIRGNRVIGPHYFAGNLNAEIYLQFLQDDLPRLLQNAGVPAIEMENLTYQHDGCPAHRARIVTAYLDETYPNNWIGNNNNNILIRWPPRSPDLTPLDFFLWGYVKDKVYLTEPEDADVVRARIQAAINEIDDAMLQAVQLNLVRRAQACIDVGGGHFEHLLV